jgi:hypothetical protein
MVDSHERDGANALNHGILGDKDVSAFRWFERDAQVGFCHDRMKVGFNRTPCLLDARVRGSLAPKEGQPDSVPHGAHQRVRELYKQKRGRGCLFGNIGELFLSCAFRAVQLSEFSHRVARALEISQRLIIGPSRSPGARAQCARSPQGRGDFLFKDRPERDQGKKRENDCNHLTHQRHNEHRARGEDAEEGQPKMKIVETNHDTPGSQLGRRHRVILSTVACGGGPSA